MSIVYEASNGIRKWSVVGNETTLEINDSLEMMITYIQWIILNVKIKLNQAHTVFQNYEVIKITPKMVK